MIFIHLSERAPKSLAYGAGIAFGLALGLTLGIVPACAATLIVAVPCGIVHSAFKLTSGGPSDAGSLSTKAHLAVALVGAILLAALVKLPADLPLSLWVVVPLVGFLTSLYGLTLGALIVIVWGERVDTDGAGREGPP